VGRFCPVAGTAWGRRSFTFVAPANAASLPYLMLTPDIDDESAGTEAVGLDELRLEDVTACP
jgi:hypothetical protein